MSVNKMKLRINFGNRQFIVNCNDLDYDRAVDLADRVGQIKAKSSLLSKYPMEEEETREKWLERISPLLEADRSRKDGESTEDHLKRLFNARMDSHEGAYEIIGAIAETFALPAVPFDDFKKVNWLDLKAFIHDVLQMADVDAPEYAPKLLSRV